MAVTSCTWRASTKFCSAASTIRYVWLGSGQSRLMVIVPSSA